MARKRERGEAEVQLSLWTLSYRGRLSDCHGALAAQDWTEPVPCQGDDHDLFIFLVFSAALILSE